MYVGISAYDAEGGSRHEHTQLEPDMADDGGHARDVWVEIRASPRETVSIFNGDAVQRVAALEDRLEAQVTETQRLLEAALDAQGEVEELQDELETLNAKGQRLFDDGNAFATGLVRLVAHLDPSRFSTVGGTIRLDTSLPPPRLFTTDDMTSAMNMSASPAGPPSDYPDAEIIDGETDYCVDRDDDYPGGKCGEAECACHGRCCAYPACYSANDY